MWIRTKALLPPGKDTELEKNWNVMFIVDWDSHSDIILTSFSYLWPNLDKTKIFQDTVSTVSSSQSSYI